MTIETMAFFTGVAGVVGFFVGRGSLVCPAGRETEHGFVCPFKNKELMDALKPDAPTGDLAAKLAESTTKILNELDGLAGATETASLPSPLPPVAAPGQPSFPRGRWNGGAK